MNRSGPIVIALVVLWAFAAEAGFYKYVDENGNVRYTDDVTQVPDGQKDSAQKYSEAVSAAPAAPAAPAPVGDEPAGRPRVGGSGEGIGRAQPAVQDSAKDAAPAPPEDRDQWRLQLEKEKADLDASYRLLTAEIEAFQAEKSKAGTQDEIQTYNQRVTALNQQIEDYEERRRELNRQIEAYNGAAMEAEKKSE